MTRERPGTVPVTWQQQPVVVEVVVPDDQGNSDQMPGLSREQRRAIVRARRRKGRRR